MSTIDKLREYYSNRDYLLNEATTGELVYVLSEIEAVSIPLSGHLKRVAWWLRARIIERLVDNGVQLALFNDRVRAAYKYRNQIVEPDHDSKEFKKNRKRRTRRSF